MYETNDTPLYKYILFLHITCGKVIHLLKNLLDAWDKYSGLVHWEDPEGSGGEGGGRGNRDGEYM